MVFYPIVQDNSQLIQNPSITIFIEELNAPILFLLNFSSNIKNFQPFNPKSCFNQIWWKTCLFLGLTKYYVPPWFSLILVKGLKLIFCPFFIKFIFYKGFDEGLDMPLQTLISLVCPFYFLVRPKNIGQNSLQEYLQPLL